MASWFCENAPKMQSKKLVSLRFCPRVLSLEAIAMQNCLDPLCGPNMGRSETTKSLIRRPECSSLGKLCNGDTGTNQSPTFYQCCAI